MKTEDNFAMDNFDSQWSSHDLEKSIENCPKADIFPVIEKYINQNMRILESGCGSGKWVFYYARKGYDISGLDWSEKTVRAIKKYDNNIKIVQGDARDSAFQDEEFDLILSLGTIEHSIEGPDKALADAYRLLKHDGLLIVTVPIMTPIRKVIYSLKEPIKLLKSRLFQLKQTLNRKEVTSLSSVRRNAIPGLYLVTGRDASGYHFFEYRFPIHLLNQYVKNAGFEIIEHFPLYKIDAVYHDLQPFSGTWDFKNGEANLSYFGKLAYKLFPDFFWHMAVCVAKKA